MNRNNRDFMTRLIKCVKRLTKITQLDDFKDITPVDLNLMCAISEEPNGLPVSVISEILGCSVPAVSKRLKPLEQGDYIIRRTDSRDHRSVNVCLTDKGTQICGSFKKETAEIMERITAEMGGDMERFAALADKFIGIAEEEINKKTLEKSAYEKGT